MKSRDAFTLLELLISISILSLIFATCFMAFSSSINAWRRGSEYLEKQHHSEFVQNQIFSALRSTAFVEDSPLNYGFWHTDGNLDGLPNDEISFVTSSSAFCKEPLTYAPHRIYLKIDETLEEPALSTKAHFHFATEEEVDEQEYKLISREIIGINCRFYDSMNEEWSDEWENTNNIPREIEITLFTEPVEEGGEPVEFSRVIEIPVAEETANKSSDE